jgi:hypothetical protein
MLPDIADDLFWVNGKGLVDRATSHTPKGIFPKVK